MIHEWICGYPPIQQYSQCHSGPVILRNSPYTRPESSHSVFSSWVPFEAKASDCGYSWTSTIFRSHDQINQSSFGGNNDTRLFFSRLAIAYKRFRSSIVDDGNAHHYCILHTNCLFNDKVRWHLISLYSCFMEGSRARSHSGCNELGHAAKPLWHMVLFVLRFFSAQSTQWGHVEHGQFT